VCIRHLHDNVYYKILEKPAEVHVKKMSNITKERPVEICTDYVTCFVLVQFH